jgi:hypothetical protein
MNDLIRETKESNPTSLSRATSGIDFISFALAAFGSRNS